jgi:indole-3-glycerol phosphate synthase
MTILNEIVARKKAALQTKKSKKYLKELKERIDREAGGEAGRRAPHAFYRALSESARFPTQTRLHLIAEIKQASPSRGMICEDFNPPELAGIYERGGATAVSVLTEEHYFKGSLNDLQSVRNRVALPLLRKDFITDDIEVLESRAFGADAILLIAAILDPVQIRDLYGLAKEEGLDALVEVHSEKEIERVAEWSAIIGINNRDLSTFQVDTGTTRRLIRYIPRDRIVVSESGLSRTDDLFPLMDCGVRAVLIGEAFMKEKDPAGALSRLFPLPPE